MATSDPGAPCPQRAALGRRVAERLEANPLVRRTGIDTAQVYHFPNYLSRSECRMLMRLIDANPHPSRLLAAHEDPEFRTSYSCDLDGRSPEIVRLDARLSELLGIPFEYGETVQGQRYAAGQQFRAHWDYFRGDQPYWPQMAARGGQRTWTAMIYLNEVEEGGATLFPSAGVEFRATQGLLLVWNNMGPDGSPNPYTFHEGVKVTRGTKYIVTKWFRERPWLIAAPGAD